MAAGSCVLVLRPGQSLQPLTPDSRLSWPRHVHASTRSHAHTHTQDQEGHAPLVKVQTKMRPPGGLWRSHAPPSRCHGPHLCIASPPISPRPNRPGPSVALHVPPEGAGRSRRPSHGQRTRARPKVALTRRPASSTTHDGAAPLASAPCPLPPSCPLGSSVTIAPMPPTPRLPPPSMTSCMASCMCAASDSSHELTSENLGGWVSSPCSSPGAYLSLCGQQSLATDGGGGMGWR